MIFYTNKKIKRTFKTIRILSFYFVLCVLFTAHILVAEGKAKVSKISKIPYVKHSVKPLDLTKPPTTEELMAAGQLGGTLYPTGDIGPRMLSKTPLTVLKKKQDMSILTAAGDNIQDTFNKIDRERLSFGKAIQEWNKHEYKKAVKMFKKYVKDNPESPWVSEATLHVGCDARYNGRYSEAEECFTKIIEDNKGKEYSGAKRLKNKARLRLAVLRVLQNNFEDAEWQFTDLKIDSLNWRDRTYASHWIQRISRYKADKEALLNCGLQALAYVLKKDGKGPADKKVMEITPTSIKRHKDELLHFVRHKEVEYHNNRAEQTIRAIVIFRKLSFGSRTPEGAQYHAILTSVLETCRLKGKSILVFLKDVLKTPDEKLHEITESLLKPLNH